jgi:flagellar biosynthesis regulator FlbT
MQAFSNREVLNGLMDIEHDVQRGKPYPALKKLRALYRYEDSILNERSEGKAA